MNTLAVYWHRSVCNTCARTNRVSASMRDTRPEYTTYCPKCRRDTVHSLRPTTVEIRK